MFYTSSSTADPCQQSVQDSSSRVGVGRTKSSVSFLDDMGEPLVVSAPQQHSTTTENTEAFLPSSCDELSCDETAVAQNLRRIRLRQEELRESRARRRLYHSELDCRDVLLAYYWNSLISIRRHPYVLSADASFGIGGGVSCLPTASGRSYCMVA